MKVKHILVSQPAPAVIEKSPFYEISQKYNAEVHFRPFINVVGVSLKEFRSQRVEILDHSAVIFTSRTTVDSFFRICEEARIAIPESMKYFCNTEAIALYLQKYIVYRKRKIFFADGKFDTFMELILKHKEENFLLTITEPNNGEIPNTLERLKLKFDKVTFAKTVSADMDGLVPADYDLLVFYSPAEIHTLVSSFGTEGLPMIATFGNGTACAASAAGLSVSTMAPTPEAPSMVKAVDLFIGKVNSGKKVDPVVVNGNCKSEEFIKAQEAKPVRKPRIRKKPESAGMAPKKDSSCKVS